jgi:hypothetical protein
MYIVLGIIYAVKLETDNRGHIFPIKIIIPSIDKFIDITSGFNYDISIGLSINDSYYIWGKCKQRILILFNPLTVYFIIFCITYRSLNINESLNKNSLFDKSGQNGKYEKGFVEFGLISS